MFGNKTFDAAGFESTWKDEKESKNVSCQTTEFKERDQGTNTSDSISIQVQTESVKDNNAISETVDMNKLAAWLKSVCPDMLNELNDVSLSSAMASCNIGNDTAVITASMIQQIDIARPNKQDKVFYASSLSWNSTGNTLAISCSYVHETWCYHQGQIYLYTFNRDNILPESPSKKLVCAACVSTISFHPTQPSVLCAGTHSGEIYLWNYQKDEEDGLICSITSHDDCITLISWITNFESKKQTTVLASVSIDSNLIIWDVDIEDSVLEVKQKYSTNKRNKIASSPDTSNKKSDKGIVHFSFSPFTSGLFVLGMEGGSLLKCSTVGAKPLHTRETSVLDPYVSNYEKHDGEINSVQFSPHRKDLFLSCGSDDEIRIFNVDQQTPVQIIFMEIKLNSVNWIVHEEKLLVGCGENGSIRLFSLLNGQYIPNTASNENIPMTVLAINKKRVDIAAFGNIKGQIQLWSIPWNNIAIKDGQNIYGK